jgi:hypothetical protein
MRVSEIILEAKVSIKDQILADVKKNGPGEYFVRFTRLDQLGFSAKQRFGRSPDLDDANFSVDYIGAGKGRPALWFYPLEEYLDADALFASQNPYVWLVKLKPNAWLQPVNHKTKGIAPAPQGKERVGMLRMSRPPAAIFFSHGFDIVGKYYDYAGQHKRHGKVKNEPIPKPTGILAKVKSYFK